MKKLIVIIVLIPLLASCQNKEVQVDNETVANKISFHTDWDQFRLYGTPKSVTHRFKRNFENTLDNNLQYFHANLIARRLRGGGGGTR